jgi:orotidine-5'-phosphate decarboxylase
MPLDPRIILGLDFSAAEPARALVARLSPQSCALKVGKELFTAAGPGLVEEFVGQGYRVFLDLKYHDIPNTVAHACAAATRLGAWMINVHACGGRAMMTAAREAIERESAQRGVPRPLLIAVTVLTSLTAQDLLETGVNAAPLDQVLRLAALTKNCGLDGVVCSPQEAALLRARLGNEFRLVTPGIRLATGARDDQARIATPEAAIRDGADYLVIGRAITQAEDPLAMLTSISQNINAIAKG